MKAKLTDFINEAFSPYGAFPARKDIQQELLTNLEEKYDDLKLAGKSDDEAYSQAIESFGDVSEIMEHIPHDTRAIEREPKSQSQSSILESIKHPIRGITSRFRAADLQQADLANTNISESDFSMSALMGSNFESADVHGSKFKAAALKGVNFSASNLSASHFDSSDVTEVNFTHANLSDSSFRRCAFKGAVFAEATLDRTEFKQSDLSEISFDNITLRGTVFESSSLKKATFSGAHLSDVSFHHSDVKQTVFDGATMDKITYALLKSTNAHLENVTVQ